MKTYKNTKVSIGDIKPYENNSRLHSDQQIDQIMQSIIEFGFTNPLLVDSEYNLIAGHGRLEAITRLNRREFKDNPITEVPCIIVDGLTEAQRKALVIADNSIALNAEWDEEMLKKELLEIQNTMPLFFFDSTELDRLFEETNELVQNIQADDMESRNIPNLDIKNNEHWDYVCFVFSNLQDWLSVCAKLGIQKGEYEKFDAKGKAIKRIGIGRVIQGKQLLKLLNIGDSNEKSDS